MKHFGLLLLLAPVPVLAQDGQFDPSFGNAGYEGYDPVSFFPDRGMDIEVAPDGRVVFGGYVYGANNTVCWVCRLLANGQEDPSFGPDGCVEANLCTSNDLLADLHVQPNGKIVGFGNEDFGIQPFVYDQGVVFRLLEDGALDTTWNHTGQSFFSVNGQDLVAMGSAVLPDERVLALGWYESGAEHNAIFRFQANGQPDPTFNGTGLLVLGPNNVDLGYNTLAVRADGKILVGGREYGPSGGIAVRRLMPDGSVDSTFATNGQLLDTLAGFAMNARMLLLPDERILMYGPWTNGVDQGIGMVRYLPDGARDPSFGVNGGVVPTPPTMGAYLIGPASLASDGRVMIPVSGTGFTNINVVAYLPDGSVDVGFGTAGLASTGLSTGALATATQGDSAIVVLADLNATEIGAMRYSLEPLGMAITTRSNTTAVSIYPVPTTDQDVYVSIGCGSVASIAVEVQDLSGRTMTVTTEHSGDGFRLVGSGMLPTGCYVVQVRSECGTSALRMLVD
ncbi:MAG: hypothetical protein WAU70_01540 [Flavobacteriales bacterium]